jgi:hypothetical protein
MLAKVDKNQSLFVLKYDYGYSCLGFNVVKQKSEKLLKWLSDRGVKFEEEFGAGELSYGDELAFEQYEALMKLASDFCYKHRISCDIDLVSQLIGLEGNRVEVVDCYGDKRRFIVGKSIGWMPAHLEILRRNSSGGGVVIGAPFKSVKVIEKVFAR